MRLRTIVATARALNKLSFDQKLFFGGCCRLMPSSGMSQRLSDPSFVVFVLTQNKRRTTTRAHSRDSYPWSNLAMEILQELKTLLRFLGLLSRDDGFSCRDATVNVLVAGSISALFFAPLAYIIQNIQSLLKVTGAFYIFSISIFNFTSYATTAARKSHLTGLLSKLQAMVQERKGHQERFKEAFHSVCCRNGSGSET